MALVMRHLDEVATVFKTSLENLGSLTELTEDVKRLKYFLSNLATVGR
jgi:hypothetical protein